MELSYQPGFAIHQKIKVLVLLLRFLPAKIHVQSALKQYKDPVLYNLLGICLIELSDFGNADKAFEEALKMDSNYDEARFNQIKCVYKQGNKQRAQNLYHEMNRSSSNEQLKDRLLEIKESLFS